MVKKNFIIFESHFEFMQYSLGTQFVLLHEVLLSVYLVHTYEPCANILIKIVRRNMYSYKSTQLF